MAASAGTITLELDANSVKLLRDLKKSQRATKKTAVSMRKSMTKAFSSIKRGAKVMAAAVAVAAFAVARLTAASLESADAIGKQADKLGIATEALAGMQLAAEITGSTQESLIKALTKMQKAIVDGAAGMTTYTRAFDALNLKARDLIKLSPDQQFKLIAESLKNVATQTEKVAAFADIFGARNSLLLNLNADALERYSREADSLGLSMSRWDVKKIEDANDALLVGKRALTGIGNSMAIAIAPLLRSLAEKFTEIAGEAGGFREEIKSIFRSGVGGAGSMIDALRSVRSAWDGIKISALGVMVIWQQAAVLDAKFFENRADADPRLLAIIPGGGEKQLAEMAAAKRQRLDAEAVLAKTIANIEDVKQRILDAADAPTKFHDLFLAAFDSAELLPPVIEIRTGLGTELTAIEKAMASLGVDTLDQLEMMSAGFTKSTRTVEEQHEALKKVLDILLELGEGAGGISLETYNRRLKQSITTLTSGIEEIEDTLKGMKKHTEETFDEMSEFSRQFARNTQDAFADFLFDPFSEGLRGMVKGFADAIRRMLANQAAAKFFNFLGKQEGFIGAFFAEGKAHGGSVAAGTSYLVGERGPELFTPGASGLITPNHKLGGGGVVIYNSFEAGVDMATVMSEVIPLLEATQRSTIAEIALQRREGIA